MSTDHTVAKMHGALTTTSLAGKDTPLITALFQPMLLQHSFFEMGNMRIPSASHLACTKRSV